MACRLTRVCFEENPAELRQRLLSLGFAVDDDGLSRLPDGVALESGAVAALGVDAAHMPASTDAAAQKFTLLPPAKAPQNPHPNGALGVVAVSCLAASPADHAEFLSALTGQRQMVSTSAGLDLALANARLETLSPPAFAFRYGAAARQSAFAVAGLTLGVKNPPETEAFLRAHGFAPRWQAGRLLVGDLGGLVLAFAPA